MTKFPLLLAAAAAAFAAYPLAARPMTAIDLQSIHRLGAPEVSPDGRWAAFTVSSTDWAKNKRVNTLMLLDLTKAGAQPRPVAGAEKGHDAVFGADGSLWFLMPVGDQDQLFRMAAGGAPVQVSAFKGDIGGFKIAPSGTEAVVWADRDLRCGDLNCASVPRDQGDRLRPNLRPIVHPALGYVGDARRPLAALRLRGRGRKARWRRRSDRGRARRRHAVEAVRRGRGDRFLARRPNHLFRASRGGPNRGAVDQPRHFRGARGRKRAAGQSHRSERRDRHASDRLARRAHARLRRDGPAGLRIRPHGADASRPRLGPGAPAGPGVGPLGRLDRMGEGRQEPAGHCGGHARNARVPDRRGEREGHPPHRRRKLRQCPCACRGRGDRDHEQHRGAR